VTEIPEHLLKRSKAAKAKADGAEGDPAASVPATTAAAAAPATKAAPVPAKAAAVVAAKPVRQDPPYVAAAKNRKKMPFWAVGALSMLPLWAFLYIRGMQPDIKEDTSPMGVGAGLYSSAACAGCHAADGSGGTGRALWNGEVFKTFPKIEDQLNFVYSGSAAYSLAGLATYGDPNREGGAHTSSGYQGAAMPAQSQLTGGSLTDAEILAVVCDERFNLGGGLAKVTAGDATYTKEFNTWCAPTAQNYLDLESGTKTFATLTAVGTKPRATTG
jgi:mono/diheme cytochrome c family protein